MSLLNLAKLEATPLVTAPFDYCIVPEFIAPSALKTLGRDFPPIQAGGSFPIDTLTYGTTFAQLSDELTGPAMRAAIEAKFNIDLTDRPATLTVRGRTRHKDGEIHLDSKTKLITVLLYLNESWQSTGGRLRLLRSGDNLDDCVAEVTPERGALVAFRCSDNAWHGHAPFVGERRSLQLNWVTSHQVAEHSMRRHRLSAFLKKMNPFAAPLAKAA